MARNELPVVHLCLHTPLPPTPLHQPPPHIMAAPKYRWPTIYPASHPDGIKLNKWILWRDSYRCQVRLARCTTTATVADHINPDGMNFDPNNLRGACRNCNYDRRRGYRPPPTTRHPEAW